MYFLHKGVPFLCQDLQLGYIISFCMAFTVVVCLHIINQW